jgi:hypothetical protein
VGGSTQLYRLDLGTGQALAVGPAGAGAGLAGLALGDGQPEPAAPPATPGFQALTPARVFDTRPASPERPADRRQAQGW